MRSYSTDAIILSRKNLGEADKILTIFSKNYGKYNVIAKGIRRPASRKRGSLEIFNYVKVWLARGKNLDIVTDVEVKDDFSAWRNNLEKIASVYHLAEIIIRIVPEGQENKQVFEIFYKFLKVLENTEQKDLQFVVQKFKKDILAALGFVRKDQTVARLDRIIESLVESRLKTKKFLKLLGR